MKRWAHVALHEYSESSAQPPHAVKQDRRLGMGMFFFLYPVGGSCGRRFFGVKIYIHTSSITQNVIIKHLKKNIIYITYLQCFLPLIHSNHLKNKRPTKNGAVSPYPPSPSRCEKTVASREARAVAARVDVVTSMAGPFEGDNLHLQSAVKCEVRSQMWGWEYVHKFPLFTLWGHFSLGKLVPCVELGTQKTKTFLGIIVIVEGMMFFVMEPPQVKL